MNILIRKYRVNHDKKTGLYVEDENGSMPVQEFETNGVVQRVITVSNVNNLKDRVFASMLEHQVQVEGEWITNANVERAIANDNTYLNTVTGLHVDKKDAFEVVDDLEKEILDDTDPDNIVSFDPEKYEQKSQLKADIAVETDVLLSQFAPTLFPLYNDIMKRKKSIEDSVA